MTARLISQHSANFNVTFMTGFGVAGSSGFADQGVIGGSENYERARMVGESLMNARMMGGMEAGRGGREGRKGGREEGRKGRGT